MFSRPNRYVFSYEKKKRAATRRRTLITILVILLVLLLLFLAFLIYSNSAQVTLKENNTVEINSVAKISDFIQDLGSGALMEDTLIDTSKLGEKEVIAKIKTLNDVKDYPFTINIVDTQPPVITVSETDVNLLKGTAYDSISKALVSDNSGEEIQISTEGEYDPNQAGEQTIKFVATDSSGNSAEAEMKVNVVEVGPDMADTTFITNNGHTAVVKDGVTTIDGVVIVNKLFGLPESYGEDYDSEALDAYYNMATKASEEYLYLELAAGFRSYWDEAALYEYYLWEEGEGTTSPVPGHSEHQTGQAMDINYISYDFAYTEEYEWLNTHSADFGFIMRYPEGKEEVTGNQWEPWHIRYVGTDLAKKLYKDGKWTTLEEYFGIPAQ